MGKSEEAVLRNRAAPGVKTPVARPVSNNIEDHVLTFNEKLMKDICTVYGDKDGEFANFSARYAMNEKWA